MGGFRYGGKAKEVGDQRVVGMSPKNKGCREISESHAGGGVKGGSVGLTSCKEKKNNGGGEKNQNPPKAFLRRRKRGNTIFLGGRRKIKEGGEQREEGDKSGRNDHEKGKKRKMDHQGKKEGIH